MLNNKERVTLAVQFATGFMQSGRSYSSFRELATLGLDFVMKMEEEVYRQYPVSTPSNTKVEVLNVRKLR